MDWTGLLSKQSRPVQSSLAVRSGQSSPGMVVTCLDRRGQGKAVQPGNREWATAIVCVNGEGRSIPPFLVVQGVNHLANWYTETGLPYD